MPKQEAFRSLPIWYGCRHYLTSSALIISFYQDIALLLLDLEKQLLKVCMQAMHHGAQLVFLHFHITKVTSGFHADAARTRLKPSEATPMAICLALHLSQKSRISESFIFAVPQSDTTQSEYHAVLQACLQKGLMTKLFLLAADLLPQQLKSHKTCWPHAMSCLHEVLQSKCHWTFLHNGWLFLNSYSTIVHSTTSYDNWSSLWHAL